MDVAPVEQRRLDAEGDRTGADVGSRRRDRFLHHIAQVAGDGHAALAGHHGAFNGQQLAAHFRPRQTRDDADLVGVLDLAIAMLWHAEVFGERLLVHHDCLLLGQHDVLHRLASERRKFALKITHTGFPRVTADQRHERVVLDRPFLRLQTVLGQGVRDEMLAGDLDLLVLGVAGDTDDLHTVHQRTWDIQRIRGRDEHDVRQVVVDLKIVVCERRVLFRVQHLEQGR